MRKTGLAAITLREEDELIEVKYTNNDQEVFLVTRFGQCIRFDEKDVRATGRNSMGVRGMNLSDRHAVKFPGQRASDRVREGNGKTYSD